MILGHDASATKGEWGGKGPGTLIKLVQKKKRRSNPDMWRNVDKIALFHSTAPYLGLRGYRQSYCKRMPAKDTQTSNKLDSNPPT